MHAARLAWKVLLAGLLLAGPATAADPQAAPEGASGMAAPVAALRAERQMIVTANPLAAEAGLAVLRAGGSAADAAVAALLVLGLVEPQSAGLGGGAFWLQYRAADGAVLAYDARETAPAAATPALLLGEDGQPLDFMAAVESGRSVGVPGLPRLLEAVQRAHGRLPWAELFAPALALAEQGFALSPRLHALLLDTPELAADPAAAAYFFGADGQPRPVGAHLVNPAYAAVLRRLAAEGAGAFYEGPIAAAIVARVNEGEPVARLAESDLAHYRVLERAPLCGPYRALLVCGFGPPSSGGVAVLQILGILAGFPAAPAGALTPEAAHLLAEASRLAFADRNAFLADADFVEVPLAALLDPAYLERRRQLISPAASLGQALPGLPEQRGALPPQAEPPSTTHLVVVDRWGDAVSVTASIETAFGSRRMVEGFLLNNQLTDFAFSPLDAAGRPVANRVEAGKRPRSSMAPTLVLDGERRLVGALGSPGGSRIIGYVVQALLALADRGLDPQQAAGEPHLLNRNGRTELEADRGLEALGTALEALGQSVAYVEMTSGLAIVWVTPAGLLGGADPRREGLVLGD